MVITFLHRTTFAVSHEFLYIVFVSRYFLISLLIFSLSSWSFKSVQFNIQVYVNFPAFLLLLIFVDWFSSADVHGHWLGSLLRYHYKQECGPPRSEHWLLLSPTPLLHFWSPVIEFRLFLQRSLWGETRVGPLESALQWQGSWISTLGFFPPLDSLQAQGALFM